MVRIEGIEALEWSMLKMGCIFFGFSYVWFLTWTNAARFHTSGARGHDPAIFAPVFRAIVWMRWTWGPMAALAALDLYVKSPWLAWAFWAVMGLCIVTMTWFVAVMGRLGMKIARRAERLAATHDIDDYWAQAPGRPNPLTFYRRGPRPARGLVRRRQPMPEGTFRMFDACCRVCETPLYERIVGGAIYCYKCANFVRSSGPAPLPEGGFHEV